MSGDSFQVQELITLDFLKKYVMNNEQINQADAQFIMNTAIINYLLIKYLNTLK